MNKEDKKIKQQKQEMEKIIKSGKYAECHIVIDEEKPNEACCKISCERISGKTMYSLLIAIRNAEKQILESNPELRVLDLFKPYELKIEPVYKSSEEHTTFIGQFLRELGKKMEDKDE